MSKVTFYNTLTGKKEEFKPITPGVALMYNCGPTVYNSAHIGNLRAYVFADVLRRTLEYSGYKVKQVMNITDVGHLTSDGDEGDDKMVKALKRLGKPMTLPAMREVADIYTEAFKKDLQALNILAPHEMPRASDHINEDIELIKTLEEKGVAYRISDGLYFDTAKFPDYGKLGNINLTGQQAGARVEVKSEKKNQKDFTLWKLSSNELGFESPWGKGFPGWHIECSAMSRKYLGQPFDIHTGGIDHIPVHHNNEIAQSESAYGVPLANFWMHNEFVNMGEAKMAKSGEDFITLQTLKDHGIDPLAYRYYLLCANYQTPMTFSWEALFATNVAYRNLLWAFWSLSGDGNTHTEYAEKFEKVMNDNLNTSEAVAVLWELIKDSKISKADKRTSIIHFDKILGLDIVEQSSTHCGNMVSSDVPEKILKLIEERENAREAKNYKESDRLRDLIQSEGYEILDTEAGATIRKIPRASVRKIF
ncbi:MAG: cysteine--tRNA ligase [bacterium]|nr:cysteine--tRNA ligase [bacterium]